MRALTHHRAGQGQPVPRRRCPAPGRLPRSARPCSTRSSFGDIVRLTARRRTRAAPATSIWAFPPSDNLAYRAARAFSEESPALDVLVDIEIEKRMPAGAGLGGGSSDAAAVLVGLAHWAASTARRRAMLLAVARALGADCAFFLDRRSGAHDRAAATRSRRRCRPLAAHVALVKPASAGADRRRVRAVRSRAACRAGRRGRVVEALRRGRRRRAWRPRCPTT